MSIKKFSDFIEGESEVGYDSDMPNNGVDYDEEEDCEKEGDCEKA
jgi:hypothetical protein